MIIMIYDLTDKQIVEQYSGELFKSIEKLINEKISKENNSKKIGPILEDVTYLHNILHEKPSGILKGIEEDLKTALSYISPEEIKNIRNKLRTFYDEYRKDDKKKAEKIFDGLKSDLKNIGIKSTIVNTTVGHKQLVTLNSYLLEMLSDSILKKMSVERLNNINPSDQPIELSQSQMKQLDKVRTICNKNIIITNEAKNINRLGYDQIKADLETIKRNEKANIYLQNVLSSLQSKINQLYNKKDINNFQRIIDTIRSIVKKNNEENRHLESKMSKLGLDNLDKIIEKYESQLSFSKESSHKFKSLGDSPKEMVEQAVEALGNLNDRVIDRVDGIKDQIEQKNNEKIEKKKEQQEQQAEIKKQINELREQAFISLYNAAFKILKDDNTKLSDMDIKLKIPEKMAENLKQLNVDPETRAKNYLAKIGRDATDFVIMETIYNEVNDTRLGLYDFKKFVKFVSENIQDKKEAESIIQSTINSVLNDPRIEENKGRSL